MKHGIEQKRDGHGIEQKRDGHGMTLTNVVNGQQVDSIIEARNYVAGSWVAARTTEWLDVTNPATARRIGRVPLSTATDVDAAVQAAAHAFPAWRAPPRMCGRSRCSRSRNCWSAIAIISRARSRASMGRRSTMPVARCDGRSTTWKSPAASRRS